MREYPLPVAQQQVVFITSDGQIHVEGEEASKHQALINLQSFFEFHISYTVNASEVSAIILQNWEEFQRCLDTVRDDRAILKAPDDLGELIRTNEEEQRTEFIHKADCPFMWDVEVGRKKRRKCTCPGKE